MNRFKKLLAQGSFVYFCCNKSDLMFFILLLCPVRRSGVAAVQQGQEHRQGDGQEERPHLCQSTVNQI